VYEERHSRVPGALVWTSTVDTEASRVLPDGCMDLIWGDGQLFIAGPDSTAYMYAGTPGSTVTGLRFAPGFAPRVLAAPACEFTDQRVPLDAVWPATEVARLAAELATDADAGTGLERIALGHLDPAAIDEPELDAVLTAARAGLPVALIAENVGLSARQLQRRCGVAFGYGAKRLVRILRMGRALDLARAGASFAETAAVTGYADQPHLARDVRELAGVSLGQLVASGNGANKSTELPSGS
jgi:AraC-like DNA-binding protein